MENLGASFLVDLEDLSDYEKDRQHMEEDVNDLDSVSMLQRTQAYIDTMNKVEEALLKGSDQSDKEDILNEVNKLWDDIENEIAIIHSFIRDKYRLKFPELESLVHHPIDYALVVKKMIRKENLLDLLPPAIVMVISILTAASASTSSSSTPDDNILDQNEIIIEEACDRAVKLDASKQRLVEFFESRMRHIAPNLSAIVGSVVAAKLMGTAGGLSSLAKMPACNVLLLGAKKHNLAGFSSSAASHVGYLEETDVFQTTPPALKTHACRLLSAKSTLAARVDSVGGDPSGSRGRTYLKEIRYKIEKLQEPPPARHSKLLRIHISERKKKRGGRRLRKMKERYAMTEVRKRANRMEFGVPEEATILVNARP